MAQDGTTAGGASYSLDNVTFPVGRNKLQSIFNAIRTNNKGASAPDLVAGQFWIDDSTDPTWTLYLYDGTDSIQFATINTTDNSVNFIDSTFTQLTSDLSTNGNDINFGDNDKAQFGAGNDLQIYSDGANGFIKEVDASGYLYIQGTNLRLQNTAGTQTYVNANDNGAVDLRYAGSTKIATTSTGIDVTGTVTASSFLSGDNSGSKLNFNDDIDPLGGVQQNFTTLSSIGGVNILFDTNNNDTMGFLVASDNAVSSSAKKRFYITENGDISFYEDTGTTPKLTWDASAESLGIGTTSPSEKLNISTKFGSQDDPDAIGLGSSYSNTAGSPSRLKVKVYDAGGDNANGLGHSAGLMNIVSGLSGHSMAFFTNSGGGSTERMRIDSSGAVGIGTSSPDHLLHISGGGGATRMKFTRNNIASTGNSFGELNFENSVGTTLASIKAISISGNTESGFVFGCGSGNTEAMRIDSSGNVGIGTTSPARNLSIVDSGTPLLQLALSTDQAAGNGFELAYDGSAAYLAQRENLPMVFKTNDTERMRIDSSGNVLVGKTSTDQTVAGTTLFANGKLAPTVDSDTVIYANRETNDGNIIELRKDGVSVGSIGSSASVTGSYIGDSTVALTFYNGANLILPSGGSSLNKNGAISLGNATNRFNNLHLAGSVYLGGTGSANALDDYEEGTWTPVIIGSTTEGTATYVNRQGYYVKIGAMVHIQAFVNYNSGTGTGNLLIDGLPFITKSAADTYSSISIGYMNNIAHTAGRIPNLHASHNGQDRLIFGESNPTGAWAAIPYDVAGAIVFAGTYITN